jgi:hypothetical protein
MLAGAYYSRRKGGVVHVALAGSVEAILNLVIDLAVEKAQAQKLSTLRKEHIRDAIASNPGLRHFFQSVYISGVPTVSYISPALIPGKVTTKKPQKPQTTVKRQRTSKHRKAYA